MILVWVSYYALLINHKYKHSQGVLHFTFVKGLCCCDSESDTWGFLL